MPTKIISKVIYDEDTGIPFLEDVQGNMYMAGNWSQATPLPADRYYLQTLSYLNFPDTDNFHPVPNKLTGELTTEYTIPNNKLWRPAFIMAAQDLLDGKESKGISVIGWYIDDIFAIAVPFRYDLHYVLYEPLTFRAGTKLSLKLLPNSRKTRVCILVGGELRSMS